MERADGPRSAGRTAAKTPKHGRHVLLKVAAWTLAVPALCAAVVVGGALPLYLILPEAEPAAERVVQGAAPQEPAQPSPPAAAPEAKLEEVAATEPVIDEATTGATVPDQAPDEIGEEPPAESPAPAPAAAAIPTPRPDLPRPYTPPSSGEAREVAAVKPAPAPREPPAAKPKPEAALAETPARGQRSVVRTAAKLRAGPQGAEIGVLPDGAEVVVVGRCDLWCEVSADGRRGFVFASLLDGAPKRAERAAPRRPDSRAQRSREDADERRAPPRRNWYRERRYDEEARYDRRAAEREVYERAVRRYDHREWMPDERYLPPEEPDWFIEDAGPPELIYEGPYR